MSERAQIELFADIFGRGGVAREVDSRAFLQAMLDVEAALARASARIGLVSKEAAALVVAAAVPDNFDLRELSQAASAAGNPVPALVTRLRALLPAAARTAVHVGATSQDIIDSALMLLARRACEPLSTDLTTAAERAAELAAQHRATLMLGRTLLQPALPIPFGLKAAQWLAALNDARQRLDTFLSTQLLAQLGGAAGSLASLGASGPALVRELARELELGEPALPWHTRRVPVLDLAMALATTSAMLGKIARDVTLLAQAEVAELRASGDATRGGSSTMPQKQNPVGAVAILACTRRAPGLLATLLACAEQEHERAAGSWHAEWEPLTELLRLTGAAAAWTREVLEELRVDPARMRRNLDDARDFPLAERLREALATTLGPDEAHAFVADAVARARAGDLSLREVLTDDAALSGVIAKAGLFAGEIASILDPADYLGSSALWIDRALAAHARSKGPPDAAR